MWGLMFWSFAIYRKRKNSPLYPKQTKENLPLELIYTAVPLVMVAVLFYFTVTTENYVLDKDAKADVTIDVTAFKWNWDFGYRAPRSPRRRARCTPSASSEEIPMLVLPTRQGRSSTTSQSKDVIHSFWVPDFLFKRDVFPDPGRQQLGERLPEHDRADRVVRRPLRGAVRHVPLGDELRGARRTAGGLRRLHRPPSDRSNPATGEPYTAAEALTALQKQFPDQCGGDLCSPIANTTYPFDTNREAKSAIATRGRQLMAADDTGRVRRTSRPRAGWPSSPGCSSA